MKSFKKMRKVSSFMLAAVLLLTGEFQTQPLRADASAKLSISANKLTIEKGKSKTLKILNAKKKVSWKFSTKKYVKIEKTGKYKIRITGKKAGVTNITAKVQKKTFTCKVTVKKEPSNTKVTKTPVKLNRDVINKANSLEQILSNHTSYRLEVKDVDGKDLAKVYSTRDTQYSMSGSREYYAHKNNAINAQNSNDGERRYTIYLPLYLGNESIVSNELHENIQVWEITENDEIISSYCADGKIYLSIKWDDYYSDDEKDGNDYSDAVLDEDTLELLSQNAYRYDESGKKEWLSSGALIYDEEQPEYVTKMAETCEAHISCENMDTRTVTAYLGGGTTQEKKLTMQLPKGDSCVFLFDDAFKEKYEVECYSNEACTEKYVPGTDDEQKDFTVYFKLREEEVEESDTISYADGVSGKMSKADFWAGLCEEPDELLATRECIDMVNEAALAKTETNMNNLKNMSETYNGISKRDSLAKALLEDANRANYFANGEPVDKEAYFAAIQKNIADNEAVSENDTVKYAICTTRTEVKWCPTTDFIGYSATDTDNEGVNSAIGINEPMVIKAQTADGKFYWGYTENCTGWVSAEDVAICSSKEEWLDSWEVDPDKKDFIVVTTDRIVTETSFYNPDISAKTLTLGTRLKLVAKEDIPENLDGRGTWNNYIVYMPTRDADGKYVKKMALISEHSKVNVGYLPFTERNILNIAFECLGNRYGWGGSLDAMDCSLYVCLVYRCFGFSLPRNTSWQQLMDSCINITGKTDAEKTEEIKNAHVGSVLYFSGHEMMYLGRYKGRTYVISALGSLLDVGDTSVRSVFSVSINTLDAKRKNGNTWLTNLTAINSFEFPMK